MAEPEERPTALWPGVIQYEWELEAPTTDDDGESSALRVVGAKVSPTPPTEGSET